MTTKSKYRRRARISDKQIRLIAWYFSKDMIPTTAELTGINCNTINSYYIRIRKAISVQNILTYSPYSGLDPEPASGLNEPVARGLDQYLFPNMMLLELG